MSKFKFQPDKKDEGSPFTNGGRAMIAQCAVAEADSIKDRAILHRCGDLENLLRRGNRLMLDPDYCVEVDYEQVTDLVSDIFHLCDREQWDIDSLISRVRKHHDQER